MEGTRQQWGEGRAVRWGRVGPERRGRGSQAVGRMEQSLEAEPMPWREPWEGLWMGVPRVPPPQGALSSLPVQLQPLSFLEASWPAVLPQRLDTRWSRGGTPGPTGRRREDRGRRRPLLQHASVARALARARSVRPGSRASLGSRLQLRRPQGSKVTPETWGGDRRGQRRGLAQGSCL